MQRSQAASPSWTGGGHVSSFSARMGWLVPAAVVAAVWFLSHPYEGVVDDARIYVTNAMLGSISADVSSDVMFQLDGQLGFTIFPSILRFISEIAGPSAGAMIISALGLAAWICALWVFVSRIAQGRAHHVIMLFVALFAVPYGGYSVFSYSEALAVPRPFAEAFILIALTFAVQGRFLVSAGLVVAAGVLHPITALPAAGVLWLMAITDRRQAIQLRTGLILVAITGVMCALGLAIADVPFFGRLFHTLDPEWMEPVKERTRYLFVSDWKLQNLATLFVQSGFLFLSISLLNEPAIRRLFVCVAAVTFIALATALLLGDWLQSVLIIQVQIWRATWMFSLLSTVALALCCIGLWKQDRPMKLVLAMLIVAWFGLPINAVFCAFVTFSAIALYLAHQRYQFDISSLSLVLAWLIAGATLLSVFFITVLLAMKHAPAGPDGIRGYLHAVLLMKVFAIPTGIAALIWLNSTRFVLPRFVSLAGTVLLCLSAVYLWDIRDPWQKRVDRFEADGNLVEMIDKHPGDVLWLDDTGILAWTLAGRSSWWSILQGASQIFSRSLATLWQSRFSKLVDAGLISSEASDVFEHKISVDDFQVTHSALQKICSVPDGPAWIIAPVWRLAPNEQRNLDADHIWTSTYEHRQLMKKDGVPRTPVAESDFYVHQC